MDKVTLVLDEETMNISKGLHVVNSMEDGVRIVSRKGVILFANKKLIEDIGYNPIGSIAECFLSDLDRFRDGCVVRFCIEDRAPKEKEEIIDGKCYSVKASPIYDENGEISSCVEVFRDISRERTLELELFSKKEKLEEDIEFAKNIQKKILPTRKKYGNLSVNFLYEPSEMLSGDVFDVFKIGRSHIGLYVADVSGHGVAAAMLAMFVKQAMRSIKEYHRSPAQTLKELYRRMYKLNLEPERYLTLFYAIYDMDKETLKYSNAGHNAPPILIRNGQVEKLELSGFPLFNVFKTVKYKEEMVYFRQNDRLLLYTDGLIEKKLNDGSFLAIEGLMDLVKNNSDNILGKIEHLFDNTGPAMDDYAVVLIERR